MIRNLEKYLFIINLFLNFLYTNSQNDIYSSITSLQDVLQTEKVMFNNLEKFVKGSELKLISLKKFLNNQEHKYDNANLGNTTIAFDNPLDKIIILSKFLKKSAVIELMLLKVPQTDLRNFTRFKFKHSYPTDEDLDGIVKGVVRLQEVYNLTATEFMKNYEINISPSDLFQIGHKMFNLNNDKFASEWLTASLKKSNLEKHESKDLIKKIKILAHQFVAKWREGIDINLIKHEPLIAILEHGSICSYKLGLQSCIIFIIMLLSAGPNNSTNDNESIEDLIEMFNSPLRNKTQYDNKKIEDKKQIFYKACRGELNKSPKEMSQLHCKYLTKNHPFLILARVKFEEFNKDPYVILFHNIISDHEIERLKRAVKGSLKRARVWYVSSGTETKSDIRTSKFAWLDIIDDKIVPILRQRMQDITHLAKRSYEKLQISNYGVGGHFGPHVDYFRASNLISFPYKSNDRIATFMFYLSDVRKGGATVFPYMNLTMWPQKGSALFWYNLHASGEPDLRTKHSACPIIEGSKWVANQWIREREQEFRRPCELFDDSRIEKPY